MEGTLQNIHSVLMNYNFSCHKTNIDLSTAMDTNYIKINNELRLLVKLEFNLKA